MNLLIKNAKTLLDNHFEITDVRVENEKIVEIGKNLIHKKEEKIIDCLNEYYLLPGFIDSHTHFGLGSGIDATADDFYNSSKLAASSGITTFIDFSDQVEGKTLYQGAQDRINEAKDAAIDYTLHQGFYSMMDDVKSQLLELKAKGINTLKVFTTYKKYGVYLDSCEYEKLFKLCKELNIMICCHCEDDQVISEIEKNCDCDLSEYYSHSILRASKAESSAINNILSAAKKFDLPIYIVHVSSKAGLEEIQKYRKEMIVIAETTNHYLLLDNSYLKREDGYRYLMTPPLREISDNRILQKALKKNFFDIVASDHCSYLDTQKNCYSDIRDIPSGIPGSQELPLILSGIIGKSDNSLIKLSKLVSQNPAKIFGLFPQKGSIRVGSDGDFVILRKQEKKFSSSDILSKTNFSAFVDSDINIMPIYTILRGNIIFDNGVFRLEKGDGKFVKTHNSSIFNLEYPAENYIH